MAAGKPKPEAKQGGKASKATRNSPRMAAVAAPKANPDLDAGVQDLAREQYKTCLHLQAAIQAQMARGEVTAAVQREANNLSRAIVALGAEIRQQEKFYRDRAAAMTDEEVAAVTIEWLAEAAPSVRRRIREAIEEMDGSSTLLG